MAFPARLLDMGRKARLFGRAGGDRAAAPSSLRRSSGLTYLSAVDPGSAQRLKNYQSYLGAITIPDVYKCASVIANTFAATDLHVLDPDDEELDLRAALPDLGALMQRPNPEMRGRQFRQTLSHHYQLTGNAIVLKDNYDGLGRPTELWPLRPDKVHILRSAVGQLAYGYDVTDGGSGKTRTDWYDGADILHVRCAHPSDPFFGLGVIEAGEQAFSRSRLVNEFALNFFSRGGIVDGVLTTPGDIPEEDRRALVSDWRAMREGARNKMRTALLWAGASYTPIQEPLGRVPVMDLTRMSLVDIAQLFGVPLQLLGDFSESNYRNAQEAVQFFYGETLGPQLAQFEEDFWNPLLESFDPSVRAEYEQREVIDYAMRAEAAARLAGTGAYSVNDIRVAGGYDPLPADDELGDMIPLPKGMTLLSPEQAAQLGAQVQEAPEELPPGPQVTELAAPPGAGATAAAQAAAAGAGPGQPPQEAQTAPAQRASKSGQGRARGPRQKGYPAALLSPHKRDEQRRRALAGRVAGQGPLVAAATAAPPLLILPGSKADSSSPDAGPAPPPDPAGSPPPRRSGRRSRPAERDPHAPASRTVSARPRSGDVERLRRAYLDWASAEQDDAAAWGELAGSGAGGHNAGAHDTDAPPTIA